MENQKQETGTLTNEQIIAHVGWTKSSSAPSARKFYYAVDINGDVAKALKKLGYLDVDEENQKNKEREKNGEEKRPEAKLDITHFQYINFSLATANNFGTDINRQRLLTISPEAKKSLDVMCKTDIAQPDHHEIQKPEIKASVTAEVEQSSAASRR